MKTTIFITIIMTLFGSFILADEIEPSKNTAMVDGNYREWDLNNDFAVAMHKAWRDGSHGKRKKAVLANAYLRYDCTSNELYVLVLVEKKYPMYVDFGGNETYVKLNGKKMVSSANARDFAWVGQGFDGNKRHAIGWEAKFSVKSGEYGFTIHSEVFESHAWQTAGSRGHTLEISCDDDDENDNLRLGSIRTGHGSADGVEFYQNDKLIVGNPKKIEKNKKAKIGIKALNMTGKKAYLQGWIDFNGDGCLQRRELILCKTISSTSTEKYHKVEIEIKASRWHLASSKVSALFRISSTDCGEAENMGETEVYAVQFVENPVAVTLSSFSATATANGIELEWKVESEINHAGYNIYRSATQESGYEKINNAIIQSWDGFSAFDGEYKFIDPVQGIYYYKLEAVEMDGDTEIFGPYSVSTASGVEARLEMPETFELKQNYPNPFNPSTTISFSLAERTNVNIAIFDVTGRVVTVLVDETMDSGTHSVTFRAVDGFGNTLPSGTYFYTMRADNYVATKSLTILK